MPINLIKVYNQLLELGSLTEFQRNTSLRSIFDRDIAQNKNFRFREKAIKPTPAEGQDAMDRLFRHLTTVITEKATRHREFDESRSIRLHWIKYHIDEKKKSNMLVFSVKEPEGTRTYIYDKDEEYVIILEPLRKADEYFLLTAYHIEGKDKARNKMMRKYKRRLPDIK